MGACRCEFAGWCGGGSAFFIAALVSCSVEDLAIPSANRQAAAGAEHREARSIRPGSRRDTQWQRMGAIQLGSEISRLGGEAFLGFKDSAATDGVDERGRVLVSQSTVDAGVRRVEALGVVVKERFEGRSVVLAIVRPDQVAALLALPIVDYLEPIAVGELFGAAPTTSTSTASTLSQVTPWGVTKVNAPSAWSYSRGAGVKVQYLDSGTDSAHADLAVAVHHGGCQTEDQSHFDYYTHGTWIAGVIGALDNSQMVVGVAPDAALWSSKVSRSRGGVTALAIRCALQFGRANAVDVISMSFGMPANTTVTDEINGAYYHDDIVVVAAAGNTDGGAVDWPASLHAVIAVTAINESDARPSFTAIGAPVELAAPGVGVLTTALSNTLTDTATGTSLAAPHVAGAAAILRAYNPTWSAVEVRRRLAVGAVDLAPAGRDIYTGFGRLNVLNALLAPPPAPPTVEISGPISVRPGASCSWQALVSGGVSPYTYDWHAGYTHLIGGEFVSYDVTGYVHGNLFKMAVTVTGEDLATSDAELWVTVDDNAPLCWN